MPNTGTYLNIVQWREPFDNEDELTIRVMWPGAREVLDELREEHDLVEPENDADPDQPGTISVTNDVEIHDGEVLERFGRKFRISITEVDAATLEARDILIDPQDFSSSAWEELWNATNDAGGFIPPNDDRSSSEAHHSARPFNATRSEVVKAINDCRARAASDIVQNDEDSERWIGNLEDAASTLEDLLGTCSCDDRSWRGDFHDEACDLSEVNRG